MSHDNDADYTDVVNLRQSIRAIGYALGSIVGNRDKQALTLVGSRPTGAFPEEPTRGLPNMLSGWQMSGRG